MGPCYSWIDFASAAQAAQASADFNIQRLAVKHLSVVEDPYSDMLLELALLERDELIGRNASSLVRVSRLAPETTETDLRLFFAHAITP